MIAWLSSAFLVVGFVVLAKVLRLVPLARWTLELIADALTVMGDRRLDDATRGRAMRRLAGRMLLSVVGLTVGLAVALLLPAAVLVGAGRMGWLDFDRVLEVALSPEFIVVSSVILLVALAIASRGAESKPSTSSYSFGEQLLHKLAFCTAPFQQALARFEDLVLRRKLAKLDGDHPIFITALPRAGTTLLLECCASLDTLATHRYRDMPFVTIPVLWARLSKPFQKEGVARERAHGDGMMIDFDSPEALEEVLWLAAFRRPYRNDRVLPFRPVPRDPNFGDRLRNQFKKLIYLRTGDRASQGRYVSKNNMNIARLAMLRSLFPQCTIVVPFRDPVQHCLSLLQQHKRFSKLHDEDPFASEYMRQIGHFDFGENLCPIDFDGWLDRRRNTDSQTLGFWLEYWIACYSYLLEHHADHINFVDYDALCNAPTDGLRRLGEVIELDDPHALADNAPDIRSPRTHRVPESEDIGQLEVQARAIWQQLKQASERSVNPADVAQRPEFARAAGAVAAAKQLPKTKSNEWMVPAAFAALLFLLVGTWFGYRSVKNDNVVASTIGTVEETVNDLRDRYLGDGLPHQFLQRARRPGGGVLVGKDLDDGKLILISSFYDGGNEIRLIRRDGSIVARWPLSYFELFGDLKINGLQPSSEWHVDVQGMEIHVNGDVVFNFEYFGAARLTKCGSPIWRLEHATHHSLEFAEGGGYWTLGRRLIPDGDDTYYPFVGEAVVDSILRVSDAGEIVSEVPLPKIFEDSGLMPLLTASGEDFRGQPWDGEIVHANKVAELTPDLAPAFPQFEAGDLLVSIRQYNLLTVVDPDTWRIKWHQTGPYLRQHDPSFHPDGTIKLFNNNAYRLELNGGPQKSSGSNIMQVDPKTGETKVLYGAREGELMLTVLRGQQKPLPEGGFLIVEFEGGRVFEVDAEGNTVWEYVNRYNDEYVAEVTGARLFDADYFEVTDWSCPSTSTDPDARSSRYSKRGSATSQP